MVKEFDEAIEIPLCEDAKTVEEWQLLLSEKCLADTFVTHFGEFVLFQKSQLYVFHEERWNDETDKERRYRLARYISENLYDKVRMELESDTTLKDKEKSKLMSVLRTTTSSRSTLNTIIHHILSKTKVVDGLFNSKPFLLGFNNGVYELLTGTFRP